jgi:hypothetical protein
MADENPFENATMTDLRDEVNVMLRFLGPIIQKLVLGMVERAYELGRDAEHDG